MINGLRGRIASWKLRRCFACARISQRCCNSTSAASSTEQSSIFPLHRHDPPTFYKNTNTSQDDENLRNVFDQPNFWIQFSSRSQHLPGRQLLGLCQNRYLTTPDGFDAFADSTIQKCKRLIRKITAAKSTTEFKRMARDFDRLSDNLCRVIDLSDFVRSVHPDREFRDAADRAYTKMFEYMNILNITTDLNDQLRRVLNMPEITQAWTEEERVVAQQLLTDFTKSAIHLSPSDRQKFVEISSQISRDGFDFVNKMEPEKAYLRYPPSRMEGLDPKKVKAITQRGRVYVPSVGSEATVVLRKVDDSDVRREVYVANHTASKTSVRRLEKLLAGRASLASLCGYRSFAHMALSSNMAKSPEAVSGFLLSLAKGNKSRVLQELSELLELKLADGRTDNFPKRINAWDKDYYTSRILAGLSKKNMQTPDPLSAYFSLGRVMQGLSRLFQRLYGVRLVPTPTSRNEVWHESVRRLDVIDERQGRIAVVYCDLFARAGKLPNPTHFTLRCSRQICEDEIHEAAAHDTQSFNDPVEAVTDGMVSGRNIDDSKLYQLPTIALICDFSTATPGFFESLRGNNKNITTLLNFNEVQTLFHEMGHAIHSILGRTALHNVAGIRCATDFAEVPSILMEHFASAPEVLALFATHHVTNEPLPPEHMVARMAMDRRLQASDTESQILLALLDQQLHAVPYRDNGDDIDSTRIYHEIFDKHASIPEPPGTSFQALFSHLFGYGANYYSYLFDRAIACKIWTDVFQQPYRGTVDREAGERFKEEVLKWGGSRDGWKCIAGVLNDPSLSDGGAEAMAKVGRWGLVY